MDCGGPCIACRTTRPRNPSAGASGFAKPRGGPQGGLDWGVAGLVEGAPFGFVGCPRRAIDVANAAAQRGGKPANDRAPGFGFTQCANPHRRPICQSGDAGMGATGSPTLGGGFGAIQRVGVAALPRAACVNPWEGHKKGGPLGPPFLLDGSAGINRCTFRNPIRFRWNTPLPPVPRRSSLGWTCEGLRFAEPSCTSCPP